MADHGSQKPADDREKAQVLVRLVEPVGMSWSDAAAQLRAVRSRLSRAMNEAITDLVLEKRSGLLRSKKKKNGVIARTRSYQLVVAKLAAHAQKRDPGIGSSVALGAASVVYTRYGGFLKACGEEVLPQFRRDQPILVASGSGNWSVKDEGSGVIVATRLLSEPHPRISFRVTACGPGAWAHMRRMLGGGGAKLGELRLMWSDRRRCWVALLNYSWPKPPRADGFAVVALHRGVGTFLLAVSSTGEAQVVDDGRDVRRAKIAFGKRIGSLRRHLASLPGRGARGHGRARRFKALESMRGREERWSDTRCKQDAAKVIELCRRWGASKLVLEDDTPGGADELTKAKLGETIAWFVERFPFYRMKLAAATAASRVGIDVQYAPLARDATTCPACGNVDPRQADHKNGKFVCLGCLFTGYLDRVSAFNMLARSGCESEVRAVLSRGAAFMTAAKKAKKHRMQIALSSAEDNNVN